MTTLEEMKIPVESHLVAFVKGSLMSIFVKESHIFSRAICRHLINVILGLKTTMKSIVLYCLLSFFLMEIERYVLKLWHCKTILRV